MRVLQVGKFYHPTPGGIETVVQNLAEGLVKSGDQVTVLCSAEHAHGSKESINGVDVVRKAYFGKLFSQPINPSLPAAIMRMAREHDLVHFHTPNPLAEFAGLVISSRVPIVVTYHADIMRQKFLKPTYGKMLRAFLSRANGVVVSTDYTVRNSDLIRGVKGRFEVIPFGIDPDRLKLTVAGEEEAKRLRGKYGRFVLFVGRLVEYKGLTYLLQAMRKVAREHPTLNLVIAGEGPLRESLIAQAAEYGLSHRVTFTGLIEDTSMLHSYYEACEFFVLPSITKAEAFGMVLLEAMAFKKPLITTILESGVCMVNAKDVTGLHVPARDPEALADAILSLATDRKKRLAMGEAARDRFDSVFSVGKMVQSYRNLYSEVIG